MRTHSSVLLQRTETLARYDFEQAIGYLEVWYPQTGETLLMVLNSTDGVRIGTALQGFEAHVLALR